MERGFEINRGLPVDAVNASENEWKANENRIKRGLKCHHLMPASPLGGGGREAS